MCMAHSHTCFLSVFHCQGGSPRSVEEPGSNDSSVKCFSLCLSSSLYTWEKKEKKSVRKSLMKENRITRGISLMRGELVFSYPLVITLFFLFI